MATVEQIAHIGIAVRELESALVLYRDRLGLSHIETKDVPERGLRGAFLQAGEALIELLAPLHCQMDGEPWVQPAGVLHVSHHGAAAVLVAPSRAEVAALPPMSTF